MTTTVDLNKIMGRVQKMLALADDPAATPAEADNARARAEALMREYRIAEEQLIATDQVEIRPEVYALWLGPTTDRTRGAAGGRGSGREGQSFYQQWYSLAYAAARHAGARIHYRWGRNAETNQYGIFAVLVGYSGDLRLAEIVYTAARIVFGERVEPKPDPSQSDAVNAYRLRSAGITRDRVAELIWGATSHARAATVGRLYKEECDRRGERAVLDGRGINAALYRDQFAKAFVDELDYRLRRSRDAADATGGALVLAGRAERIDEAFYTEFPELRPKPKTEVAETEAPVPPKKERKRKPYWETAAGQREMERRYSGLGAAATRAGRAAAAEVELDRAPSAQRLGRERDVLEG